MRKSPFVVVSLAFALSCAFAQPSSQPQPSNVTQQDLDDNGGKRILWIIPNFRTATFPRPYTPLTVKQKYSLATQDAFDRGTFGLAALFAGEAQLSNSNPSFGQGAKGFGHYFITSYADYAIGDYMTEAVFPTLLHQDPRFFRRGKGSGMSRLSYAASQVFVTHNDSGRLAPNYSELLGNSAAVAISMSYYPDSRHASDAVSKLGTQLGVDMVSNILKEFWPDVSRKFSKKQP